jgi:hypothetical protein
MEYHYNLLDILQPKSVAELYKKISLIAHNKLMPNSQCYSARDNVEYNITFENYEGMLHGFIKNGSNKDITILKSNELFPDLSPDIITLIALYKQIPIKFLSIHKYNFYIQENILHNDDIIDCEIYFNYKDGVINTHKLNSLDKDFNIAESMGLDSACLSINKNACVHFLDEELFVNSMLYAIGPYDLQESQNFHLVGYANNFKLLQYVYTQGGSNAAYIEYSPLSNDIEYQRLDYDKIFMIGSIRLADQNFSEE